MTAEQVGDRDFYNIPVTTMQLEVDGMPRHVADLRKVPVTTAEQRGVMLNQVNEGGDGVDLEWSTDELPQVDTNVEMERRYPIRERHAPERYGNPVVY